MTVEKDREKARLLSRVAGMIQSLTSWAQL